MGMPKISIIVSSEKLDKLFPAVTLATTAAVMGWEAELFFTFWGLLALKKGYEPKEVSLDYKSYEGELRRALSSGAIPNWRDLLREGKKTGKLKVYACSATMSLLGLKAEDLEDYVDEVVGAVTFLSRAKDSEINLFI
ncbi:MAG: DsrE/DsrF/DrsH-like family protein [Candidatus Nezhaarchaeota archaeon]|nr:DsrE/DsrF/DrsH-like family protein [Candidatus Nezhaarchaeota archaeon]MCX8141365.1 DsrE/DsrF/DrsH-like family protein [Candidatus Nezhaarchaeota archaeon]MDW8049631.1 DsrE/DsrF/DrsH-like family protein [Nitrososphaerota archaeon]